MILSLSLKMAEGGRWKNYQLLI